MCRRIMDLIIRHSKQFRNCDKQFAVIV